MSAGRQPGSEELQSEWHDDAIVEPPNSTVDDWIGQRVDRDAERADEAMANADGDEREAEREFEQRTERRADETVPASDVDDDFPSHPPAEPG